MVKALEIFSSLVKPKEVEPIPENEYKSEVKKRINDLWFEFKDLQDKQDSKFVEIDGKRYDFDGFLKLKTNGTNPD